MPRAWIVLLFCVSFLCSGVTAFADGGAVVFSGESGPVRATVFVEPVPPRVGQFDLSLLLQDRASLEPIAAYGAILTLTSEAVEGDLVEQIETVMDRDSATNALLQSALIETERAGRWQVTLVVDQVNGSAPEYSFSFPLEVAPRRARFWDVAIWIALPLIPLLLFLAGRIRRVARELSA